MAGVEEEADVLDKRRRAGRRATIDARVGEGEVADLHRWRHRGWGTLAARWPEEQGWFGWWSWREKKSVVAGRGTGPVFDVARKMKEPADSRRPRLSQSDRSGFPNL